jgi:hypothetical protein
MASAAEGSCDLSQALEQSLRPRLQLALEADAESHDVLAPSMCHVGRAGTTSMTVCDQLAEQSGRQPMFVIRMHKVADAPWECFARGPFPVRMEDLWRLPDL